ncbi:glycosyl hydrolase 108 family protein [Duncaniella muris]|uniref:glycoside hydrolase family 108 protein n=1 Tax=Duncaniella muris TaxID=2094150 RepID=UPI0025A93758|nr:glycosyl hydrolase 108 family protein [Duncaniella muris]
MANVEKIVPFIIQFEAGVNPAGLTGEKLFEKARKTGYANDPDDLGGATMVGVTIATYTEYCRKKVYPVPTIDRLHNMTYAQWLDILKTMFWDRWRADEIANQSVAEILVDWVWASGKYGITIPQQVLGVTVDGVVGPKTLAALNKQNPAQFFARIVAERKAYIDRICTSRPTNNKYKRGWLNRLNAIKFQP